SDANGARVLLEAGEAEVSIQHRVGRKARWNVEAGPYRVAVTGTRFRVAWNPAEQAFELALHEGNVLVSSNRCLQQERVVHAGETLALSCATRSKVAASASVEVVPTAPPVAGAPSGATWHAQAPKASARAVTTAETEALDAFREPLAAGHFAEALRLAERAHFERVIANASRSDLLQLADAARLSGRIDRAVQALGAVRQRFPGSEEAGTAAFSLGRIAFDQHKAYGEASQWFSTYLAEQPGGPLMGDAFGRLIEARERSGDLAGARTEAERYLRRFPQGPYAAEARRILATE
ncbi:MAG TPA: tetratricopeptide repeat protein, partial [Polyangiaceae bacterium]|nr:tetratricopeptide repeat protein [Polyangiaceae bacterium]